MEPHGDIFCVVAARALEVELVPVQGTSRGQIGAEMLSSSPALCLCALALLSSSGAQLATREDGRCGVVAGVETGCEHIPPFPTCCQENGHCGWDCDGGEAAGEGDTWDLTLEMQLNNVRRRCFLTPFSRGLHVVPSFCIQVYISSDLPSVEIREPH